jgi:hypothetical protein
LSKFWNRSRRSAAEGPAYHPRPRPEFSQQLAARVHQSRRSSFGRARLAYAGGLTAVLLVALGAFGGLGYAATGGKQAAKAATQLFSKGQEGKSSAGDLARFKAPETPAQNQYRGQRCTIRHRTGNGRFIIIEIAGEAVPAHMAHGDPPPIECHPR